MNDNSNSRWLVTIHYNSESGIILVDHDVEELDEIVGLVEAGPDWNTIDKIEISLARRSHGRIITIEEAREL
jgi:hypothetical protein